MPGDDPFEIMTAVAGLSREHINAMLLSDPARAVDLFKAVVEIIPDRIVQERATQLSLQRVGTPKQNGDNSDARDRSSPAASADAPVIDDLNSKAGASDEAAETASPEAPVPPSKPPTVPARKKGRGKDAGKAGGQMKFSKPRLSMMTEAVILARAQNQNSSRAVSIDHIETALTKTGIPVARPSLVTKLNRMKELELLDWDKASRGKDIKVTAGGRKHLETLRDRYLSDDELDFLKKGDSGLFP